MAQNYYQFLKISVDASVAEILSAIDIQYNQWRRLVTHHDPEVVAKANQALRGLEAIRTILSDPKKRSIYDASISLDRTNSGLVDPDAQILLKPLNQIPSSPYATKEENHTQSSVRKISSSLWNCPKCNMQNLERSEFCLQCGSRLLRTCPDCGKNTSLITTGICGNCGTQYDLAIQKKRIRERLYKYHQALSQEEQKLLSAQNINKRKSKIFFLLLFVTITLGVLFLLLNIREGNINNYVGSNPLEPPREEASGSLILILIPLFFLIPITLIQFAQLIRNQGFTKRPPNNSQTIQTLKDDIIKNEQALQRLETS